MPSLSSTQVEKETDAFYVQYGKAVEAWASLEHTLALTFRRLTSMEWNLSDAVFYSGRSFQTRRDLLLAALPHSKLDPKITAFLKTAIKKATKYSTSRNKIAHRAVAYNSHYMRVELREGDDNRLISEDVLVISDLENITQHFLVLGETIFSVLSSSKHSLTPREALERVRALPNEAQFHSEARSNRAHPPLHVPSSR